MAKLTLKDIRTELTRELDARKKIYPRWILNGKIKEATARHRIACMEEGINLLRDLEYTGSSPLIKEACVQGKLFDGEESQSILKE